MELDEKNSAGYSNDDLKEIFLTALKNNDLETFRKLPKSDLHNHASRCCDRSKIEKIYGCIFPEVPKFSSLEEMDDWYDKTIDPYTKGKTGYMARICALMETFSDNSVVVASPIFGINSAKYFNYNLKEYYSYLKDIISALGKNMLVLPEFEVCRGEDPNKVLRKLEEAAKYDFYRSIDIRGDESLGTKKYSEVFKKAREMGYSLKAHVGEFADVSMIDEALEYLDLDYINHGLSLIQSNEVMNYVRDKGIVVNCCPTSNYLLSRVDNYKNHPIKDFLHNGIICTINTDDELTLNSSITHEYFKLFNSGCLTAEELYEVNQNGLNYSLSKRRGNNG